VLVVSVQYVVHLSYIITLLIDSIIWLPKAYSKFMWKTGGN